MVVHLHNKVMAVCDIGCMAIPYIANCLRWKTFAVGRFQLWKTWKTFTVRRLHCMAKAYRTGYFDGKVLQLSIDPQKL